MRVLDQVAGEAGSGRARAVLVEHHAVDELVRRVARRLRADDVHLVTGLGEGLALEPHAPVEGHGEVLDDDEDATARPGGPTGTSDPAASDRAHQPIPA